MAELKDSGARREFSTGAVRDIQEGKGRCDLLPLDLVGNLLDDDDYKTIFALINVFHETGDSYCLKRACDIFIKRNYPDVPTATLELAKHYEDGAHKYSDRNWEHGIPLHCFIDSGVRHLLKVYRGDTDEPHDRAFLWNMIGAVWTMNHHPELDDYTQKDNNDIAHEFLYEKKKYIPTEEGVRVDITEVMNQVQKDETLRDYFKKDGWSI